MCHHLSEYRATGTEVMTGQFLMMIAEVLGQLKQFKKGLRTIEPVFSYIGRSPPKRRDFIGSRAKCS